ncbi:hypothetical protein ACIRQP_36810 [Streptomyces sp. NPDC102274]|uniref:hypothetical protein n=1 Tax=Streptomyces sp. NPDC102274 TaxID=3366151 RepID=UPI003806B45E
MTSGWSGHAAYGEHLAHVPELIPALLYRYTHDRRPALTRTHTDRRRGESESEAYGVALECRDDLLETGVVLGRPRPVPDTRRLPVPSVRDVTGGQAPR